MLAGDSTRRGGHGATQTVSETGWVGSVPVWNIINQTGLVQIEAARTVLKLKANNFIYADFGISLRDRFSKVF